MAKGGFRSPRPYIEHSVGKAKGAHEVDEARARPTQLGYTSGS
jgi:hypothetical protein